MLKKDDDSDASRENTPKKQDKYSRSKGREERVDTGRRAPPTLSELEADGGYVKKKYLNDINGPYGEQEDDDLKRELIFKFDLLKKSYPNALIPEFNVHSDYMTMKKTYESTIKRLSLDSSVEDYKKYLIGGFMVVEYVLGYFMNFDMQGFTNQQILSMNSYEKLLIELGEKSYVPSGSRWPVELRLLFLIILNAVMFIISKMILKKTGSNLMNMMNNMNAGPNLDNSYKKKRMRGPNIDLNNIPDI